MTVVNPEFEDLPPLVDVDLVAERLHARHKPKAAVAARLASGVFRTDVKWPVSRSRRSAVLPSDGVIYFLQTMHLVEVHSIIVNGDPVAPEWLETCWDESGVIELPLAPVRRVRRGVHVDFTDGFDPIPAGIQAPVLEAAVTIAEVSNPAVASHEVGIESLAFHANMAAGTTPGWNRAVARHRLISVR